MRSIRFARYLRVDQWGESMVERRRRFPSVRGAVVAALLLAILPAAPALAAPASPRQSASHQRLLAQAKELQQRLDQQYADLERLSEQLVKAEEVERQLREEQAGMQLLRQSAEQELATSQKRLELLRGGDSQAELEVTSQSVRQERRRKVDIDRVRGRIAVHLARQERRQSTVEARRKRLDLLNKRLEATLEGLDRRLKGALEAQQAQTEVRRRAAYDLWAGQVGGHSQAAWLQSGRAAQIAVAYAMRQLGKPYQWGAQGPDRFDCSGLTSAAYRAAGVVIPRVAADQFYAGVHVGVADLLAGDLIFYADNPADPATIHHVGMYIGKGLMIHAPHTGDVVRIASIWRTGYAGAVRVVPGAIRPGTVPPTTAPPPVPNPPVGTLPPTTVAAPTTRQAQGSTSTSSTTTSPSSSPTTAPSTTLAGSSTTTQQTTATTEPTTTAAPTTTAGSTTTQQTTATTEPTTTAAPTTTAGSTTTQQTTTTTPAAPTTTAGSTTTTSGG
jgi:cell wall-associated NlpC family hydrolase